MQTVSGNTYARDTRLSSMRDTPDKDSGLRAGQETADMSGRMKRAGQCGTQELVSQQGTEVVCHSMEFSQVECRTGEPCCSP